MTRNLSCRRYSRGSMTNGFTNMFVGSMYARLVALGVIFTMIFGFALPNPFNLKENLLPGGIGPISPVKANGTYYDFSGGNLTLTISASTTNLITSNDDWSGVTSAEGYSGQGLTSTHGVDPQTVLGTEFGTSSHLLPNTPTQVNANKGNPSAYNAGGLTEFDAGPEYALGFQGNVQNNPYLVFYLNTTGHSNVTFSFTATDLDGGSNNSVSPVALQYRVGNTGLFTNLPAGYIPDVTIGGVAGQTFNKSVLLPPDAGNQAQVQVRLITTNAANASGGSTPDEWIGINNVVISVLAPTAASVPVGGTVTSAEGMPVSNATVTMTDMNGAIRQVSTNQFGFFTFENVEIDRSYLIEVSSRRYEFSQPTQLVYVGEAMKSLNFQAAPNFYDFAPKRSNLKIFN